MTFYLHGKEMLTSNMVINEMATVKYVCSYMTKGEKEGETLKRVAKECQNDPIHTQMNKIKKEFLGKQVLGVPESTMQVLSMWLMQKSRKVVPLTTSMKDECVSLPKPQSPLAQLHDDDEDVFATSLIDRYAARPVSLQNMCLASFAVTYDVIQSEQRKKKLMVSMMKKKKCKTQEMITL